MEAGPGPVPGTKPEASSPGPDDRPTQIWSPDELRRQSGLFRRFLSWLLVPFLVFAPYDLWLYFAFDDVSSGLLGVLLLGLVPVFLVARRLLDRGHLDRSVGVTVGALLVPATLIVFLRPFLYPVLVIGCLLAVAVALPFVARRTLHRLIAAAVAASGLIVFVGATLEPWGASGVSSQFERNSVAVSLFVVTGLVFLMVWFFSSRLTESLAATRRSRETLALAHSRLRELDRVKTEFMNMTAHEFATPLTPIQIQLHLLRTSSSQGLTEAQRSSLAMIERNFSRLAQLSADLLDMTRVQAGKLRLDRKPERLAGLVAEAVRVQQGVAEAAGIRLWAQMDDTLVGSVDARRLAQVLDNLLANALKFTPRGGEVQVELLRQDGEAVFRVRDNGVGLTADDQARLFQAFSQAEGRRGGTGLGLFISRGIIEAHGGRIWATSPGRGQGSTFAFQVPLWQPVFAVPSIPATVPRLR